MSNLNRIYKQICNDVGEDAKIIGKCESCKQVLTDDYTIYTDSENNLFCCTQCALDCYGVEEYDEY